MKKVIFLCLVLVSSAFAGFFSSSLVETTVIDGEKLRIFTDTDSEFGPNYFVFQDTLRIYPNEESFRPKMPERMDKVLDKINSFGKEKGFKSFIIVNSGVSFLEGFPINDRNDLKNLCFYHNYCSMGNNPLFEDASLFRFKIVYFKEKNLNYFQVQ